MLELTSGNELPCLWGARCTTSWNALNSLPWYTNSKANSLPIPVLLLKTPVLQHQTPALGLSPAQSIPHLISSLNLDWTSLPSVRRREAHTPSSTPCLEITGQTHLAWPNQSVVLVSHSPADLKLDHLGWSQRWSQWVAKAPTSSARRATHYRCLRNF